MVPPFQDGQKCESPIGRNLGGDESSCPDQGRSMGANKEVRTEPGGPEDGKKGHSVPIFSKVNEKTWVITGLSARRGIAACSMGARRK